MIKSISNTMNIIGCVVIGRNEGDRLIRCLKSLKNELTDSPIVYVDSGSTDQSVYNAESLGIKAISLDLSLPFTMARGRNTGYEYLTKHYPTIEYIQFIDGDCELIDGWLEQAYSKMQMDKNLAIVCGRRKERFPNASIYNFLADMEWNTPIGKAKACGGDALVRVTAIHQVGGYNSELICGEEPEMCIRLHRNSWEIERIQAEMTLHDLHMYHFNQWWKRMIRTGWAVAEGYSLYGKDEEKYMRKEYNSGWLWGVCIPFISLLLAFPTNSLSLTLFLLYLYLGYRIYSYRRQYGDDIKSSLIYSVFCTISKFPQVTGQIKYWFSRWKMHTPTIIEYKTVI